jgi:LDH2 family malate/lactate/ureidoglycolate dehydrogenase
MSDAGGRIAADDLVRFVAAGFASLGAPQADAREVAELMVEADLLGAETHGVFRLRQYVNRLRDGGTNPRPRVAVLTETAATALVDGDNGLGHLAMKFAVSLAMEKAAAAGIGWVGVRNGNHAGPAALYVRPQTERGMIGLCAAVGSANHVPPFGGSDLLLGTNPIAVAVPAGTSEPFVLDMATTVAAVGKIKTLAQRGEAMPEGWMVGRDGRPLTDPARREEGFLLPIGGAKGYGLAMAIGLLAGVLNGAAFGQSVVDFTKDTTSATNTGQFVAAIAIEAFGDVDAFPRTEGRGATYHERRTAGLPLHPDLLAEARQDRARAPDPRLGRPPAQVSVTVRARPGFPRPSGATGRDLCVSPSYDASRTTTTSRKPERC